MLAQFHFRLIAAATIISACWLQSDGKEFEYDGTSVVVVANREMPGSVKVAKAYMKMRGIPPDHLIRIRAPVKEQISRKDYLETIHNPVLETLLSRKLIDAFEGTIDGMGRKSVTVYSSKLRYLVLCYGVPLKIAKTGAEQAVMDEALLKRYFLLSNPQYIKTFSEGRMARNDASVDGELALLLKRDTPIRGFIPNPLYLQTNRTGNDDILRVTRLDGPTAEAVIGMLESARMGELNGLMGRAYVDEDGRKGGFEIGNKWMNRTALLFKSLGFDISHDTSRSTFSVTDRFDAPVLYGGWYAWNCEGPFTLPGFRFPDGAVAAHLHSFSAASVRSTTKGWVGPFVDKGVACTFGNVDEPYLTLTHQFDAFFKALSDGWNFADAAYYALPGLSWQAVAVGDPLYRPFAKGLDEQLNGIDGQSISAADQYVIMRKANLVRQAGQDHDINALITSAGLQKTAPSMALWQAQNRIAEEDPDGARSILTPLAAQKPHDASEWGLYAEVADTLAALDTADAGLQIHQVLQEQKMPPELKLAFMERGVTVAEKAGNQSLASEWREWIAPDVDKE